LLDDILANPADEALRLVYADQLVADGDPRGEFIQVQCALAHAPGDRRRLLLREAELLAEHGERFQPPIESYNLSDRIFRRGFVEHGRTGNKILGGMQWDEICARTPLRSLHLTGTLFDRIEAPWSSRFAQLDALHYEGFHMTGLGALLGRLPGLRTLTLEAMYTDVPSEPSGVERLVLERPNENVFTAPAFANLRALDLDFVYPDDEMINGLVQLPLSVEDLRIRSGRTISAAGFERLVRWPGFAQLVALDLSGNAIGADGARAMPPMPRLRRLELYEGVIGAAGITALPELPALVELSLDNNGLEDSAVPIIVAKFPRLKRLDLTRSRLSAQAVRALVAGMRELEHLRIAMSSLDDGAARAIAEADSLRGLVTLELNGNDFTSDGFVALAGSPNVARLERLVLRRCYDVDQRGIDALAGSPHLDLLCHLEVHVPYVDAKFKTRPLEERFGRRLVVKP
jgi:uncharacterized protein (TIGR02996 family)